MDTLADFAPGKAEVQDRRNEKIARKNPERIQKQIDDLKAASTNGGKLSKHEEQVLEGMEKELRTVKKARDAMGDKAPTFGRSWNGRGDSGGPGVLGKRRRGSRGASSSDSDVPDDVRRIPMPRDTPPPIPKELLDEWFAKRRARRNAENEARWGGGDADEDGEEKGSTKKGVAGPESKTVYEAKPMVRDLRKEAVSAFVPASVQMKLDKGKGQGGLMEPEEADRLEQEGYLRVRAEDDQEEATGDDGHGHGRPRRAMVEDVEDDAD